MLNSKRHGQRGVSLIEVLVALFIMTVVGAAILAGTYVNIKSTGVAREGILAEGLAKYELEYVKAAATITDNWTNTGGTGIIQQVNGYSYTIPPGPGPSWYPNRTVPFDSPSVYAASEYAGYTVTIKIEDVLLHSDEIRKVTATVSYPGRADTSIETYVSGP
jgi:prepilin-type N-terminal cleavage/methylation domain-containing protein